jgi:acyl-coenzyme A synthetase/AMP-(fatty) acid ligase
LVAFLSHDAPDPTKTITEVTYGSCYGIVLRLALKLLSAGVCAHWVVPIILDHPVEIAMSMIAVMVSGAAYAVVEPKALKSTEIQE